MENKWIYVMGGNCYMGHVAMNKHKIVKWMVFMLNVSYILLHAKTSGTGFQQVNTQFTRWKMLIMFGLVLDIFRKDNHHWLPRSIKWQWSQKSVTKCIVITQVSNRMEMVLSANKVFPSVMVHIWMLLNDYTLHMKLSSNVKTLEQHQRKGPWGRWMTKALVKVLSNVDTFGRGSCHIHCSHHSLTSDLH